MDEKASTELVPVSDARAELPPILAGRHTAAVEAQVRSFYLSVADIFERWVTRRASKHTQRAYRQDVMDFVRFLGIRWPDESTQLFTVSVADVITFRDRMVAEAKAPKTINRRIASLSSFYKYLQGVVSEFRLPITVPNPGTPSSSPGARRTHATRPRPSRRPAPGSSWGCPPVTRCSTTGTGPSSSSSSIAGPGSAPREGRQAPADWAALCGGRGDRGVRCQGGALEGAALSCSAQLAQPKARSCADRCRHDV